MISLTLAALFFLGIHLFISGTRLRDTIIAAIGERAYLGAFSLSSLAGISWLCTAYARSETELLWAPLPGMRTLALFTMLIAFLFNVIGITTPNPTAFGGEKQLAAENPARGALSITRHPFLWGVAIWAATHFLLNGDLASSIFFGTMIVLPVAGTVSIDHKRKRTLGDDWQRFEDATSNVPFAAVAAGRCRLDLAGIAWWQWAAAVGLYAATLVSHGWLFGAPAIG
jgi:uncharacterized membrane protein